MQLKILAIDLNDGVKIGELNIGLIEILSYLKQRFDLIIKYVDNFDNEMNKLKKLPPNSFDFIIISSKGYELEKKIKRISFLRKKGLLIFGGPGITTLNEYAKYSDISIIGEGEIPLEKVFKVFIKWKKRVKEGLNDSSNSRAFIEDNLNQLKKIDNLIINVNGHLIKTKRRYYKPNEFEIPRIDYTIINLKKYVKKWEYFGYLSNVRGISIVTSRSCPYQCSFCQPNVWQIFGPFMKFKRIDYLKDELKELHEKYGINAFMIHDDTFTINKEHANDFADMLFELKREGIKFKWICNTRADQIDANLIKKFKAVGCVEIRLGIETLNEKLRNQFLNKNLKDESIFKAIKIIKKHGLKILGFFMIGLPKKSAFETLLELLKVSSLDLDMVSISILTPLPGTHLGEKYHVKHFGNYYFSNQYKLTHISNFTLELLRKLGVIIFYFNPLKPKRMKLTLKLLTNFKRKSFYFITKRFFGLTYN